MSDAEPQAYRETVESLLAADPEVSESLMMGMPSLKQGSKMFGDWAGLADAARLLAASAS